MKKYAKIINDATKQCNVAIGDNEAFYKSIGFMELEVEEDHTGNWYIKGYLPEGTLTKLKEYKIQQIKLKANQIIESTEYYPLFKQLNIQREYSLNPNGETSSGTTNIELFNEMNSFINSIRDQSNTMEETVNRYTTIDEVENFEIEYITTEETTSE